MTATYPYAVRTTRIGTCVLCALVGPHPDTTPEALMYHVAFSVDQSDVALLCKPHAIECDLITDRLVAARNRAEVAVIQHLRREMHRLDVCPLPHEPEVVSHRETECNRCGVPNLSSYVLRVWSHPQEVGPTVRTDVHLCAQHRPDHLPLEVPITLDENHGQMVRDLYVEIVRPLLKFDGADEAVITNIYLARMQS